MRRNAPAIDHAVVAEIQHDGVFLFDSSAAPTASPTITSS
ncbi:hypothetical protein M6B38_199540 [Iris pallida]|uniref:Uncharacterized protein n=1 Tax=Iris pallida TaxID=29817 RepID=A0AAX6EAT5_IRIPA|nr:hypothetical protein M6B38_199540 [Iris pallida]